jgi:hypothetical protein
MATSKASNRSANRPEKKIGPLPGGLGLAIWLNSIETENGPRKVRSITLSPRRYRDETTGEWKDSSSFQIRDIPALMFALEKAQEYVFTHPLDDDQPADKSDVPY